MDVAARRRRWQIAMFGLTWLTYVTFYLVRKNYPVALPAFMEEFSFNKVDIGDATTAYLVMYAIGQFTHGPLADRYGPRKAIAIGLGVSVLMSFGLSFASTIAAFTVLYGINGLAQAAGWPSVTKAMTNWIPVKLRGRVMGLWGTCYPLGDAVATGFAGVLLGYFGWRAAFWVPAIVASVVGVTIVVKMRNHPRDLGLQEEAPAEDNTATKPAGEDGLTKKPRITDSLKYLANAKVLTLGAAYFGLKFVRYSFIFWIGIYLVEAFDFNFKQAALLQVPFPVAGLIGSVFGGWLSDRVFQTRRAPAAIVMLIGLMGSVVLLQLAPGNMVLIALAYGAVGFFLFGPDMLISGTAAMDFGSEKAAATVSGFVNGVGSIGGALSGVVIGRVAQYYGWSSVFYVLLGMIMLSMATTAILWNAKAPEPA